MTTSFWYGKIIYVNFCNNLKQNPKVFKNLSVIEGIGKRN